MTTTRLLVAAALVLALAALWLLVARRSGPSARAVLADPVRTPGVLNPEVTQATIRRDHLHARLDGDGAAAGRVHERAEARADAGLRRDAARCPRTRRTI